MTETKLTLVYSEGKRRNDDQVRTKQTIDEPVQLSLFDNALGQTLHVISVEDFDLHSFRNLLRSTNAKLIFDTRSFPEFFAIFSSAKEAFSEFKRSNISYCHVPVDWLANWTEKSFAKSQETLLASVRETLSDRENQNSSAIFLVSTEKSKIRADQIFRENVEGIVR